MAFIHEMIHVLFIPEKITSDKIMLGFLLINKIIPSFGVMFLGEKTKKRTLVVLIMPFIILTVIPTILMVVFNIRSYFLFLFVMLNACGSLLDIIIAIEFMFTLPKKSIVFLDYWREY